MNDKHGTENDGPGSLQRMVRPSGKYHIQCLLNWHAGEQNKRHCKHDVVTVDSGWVSVGDIEKPEKMLAQAASGGSPDKLSDASLVVNDVAMRKTSFYKKFCHACQLLFGIFHSGAKRPNDPSSATRPTGRVDCNREPGAGFAAAHG